MNDSRSNYTTNANNKTNNGKQWNQLSPTPQYTLPGVINYLTSEFTNLERFKIMTNLEKSEMKYKIIQLQGEVNSLKFINNKQSNTINQLQQKLQAYENSKGSDDNTDSNSDDPLKNADATVNNVSGLYGASDSQTGDSNTNVDSQIPLQLPEIDLLIIKKSRYQLTKSMKEIVHLLKTPSVKSINCLNLPDPDDINHAPNEFDILISNNEDFEDKFEFNNYPTKVSKAKMNYVNDTKNLVNKKPFKDLADVREESEPIIQVDDYKAGEADIKPTIYSEMESDTETVIVDETEQFQVETANNNSKQFTYENYLIRITQEKLATHLQISRDSKEIFNQNLALNKISIENILQIYPILIDKHHLQLLVIDKEVGVISLVLDHQVNETTLAHIENITSSDLHKVTTDEKLTFALIIEGMNSTWFLKVYEIAYDPSQITSQIQMKQIADYSDTAFATIANSIRFLKWDKNDIDDKFPKGVIFEIDGNSITVALEPTKATPPQS